MNAARAGGLLGEVQLAGVAAAAGVDHQVDVLVRPGHHSSCWRRAPEARARSRDIGKACRVESLIELLGAILLLSAFMLAQSGRLDTASPTYLLLNLAGSGILASVAAFDRDFGFLLLEGVWAGVSAYAVVRRLVRR